MLKHVSKHIFKTTEIIRNKSLCRLLFVKILIYKLAADDF